MGIERQLLQTVKVHRRGHRDVGDGGVLPGEPRTLPQAFVEDAGQLVELYHQCQAFVAPTRGEGFGLPMAEAMWLGLPVLTTAYGGQADFCTPETSWLIDFRWAPAQT